MIFSQWRLFSAYDKYFSGRECSPIFAGKAYSLQIGIKKSLTIKDPYVGSICKKKDDRKDDGEVKNVTSAN